MNRDIITNALDETCEEKLDQLSNRLYGGVGAHAD
jgi:hypothetical protein